MIPEPIARVVSLLTEPTIGIPTVATLALIAAWFLWSPRPVERPPALRRTWFPPTADAVSTVYYALAEERYSTVLALVYERLDRAVEGRYHRVIAQLPLWRPERVGVPDAPPLRRAARGLRRAHAEAVQRESPFYVRWAFWRSAEADENRFLARVDDAISVSAQWISKMEGTA